MGSLLLSFVSSGSHFVSTAWSTSAWWYVNPSSTRAGTKCDASRGTVTLRPQKSSQAHRAHYCGQYGTHQTPLRPLLLHEARECCKHLRNRASLSKSESCTFSVTPLNLQARPSSIEKVSRVPHAYSPINAMRQDADFPGATLRRHVSNHHQRQQ